MSLTLLEIELKVKHCFNILFKQTKLKGTSNASYTLYSLFLKNTVRIYLKLHTNNKYYVKHVL